MSKHSQIEIDCEVAAKLAAESIRSIDESREAKVQKIIDQDLKELNNGFWHKLFKKPDWTREEVMERDLNSEWSEIYDARNFLYGRQYDVAHDVLRASKVGGKMLLSLDDYRRIS